LIMHQDNLNYGETVKAWTMQPANKKLTTPGDDRTPAWVWIGYLYHDTRNVGIPSDNLMTMLREGGAKVSTGTKSETFKRQTQSGVIVDQTQWDIIVDGKSIPYAKIKPLIGNNEFQDHIDTAESLGFELFVKRAKIGQSKHIRVRPLFRNWSAEGSITVFDEEVSRLTKDTLFTILNQAGMMCGMCDWRPSSPRSPGSYGKFIAEIS